MAIDYRNPIVPWWWRRPPSNVSDSSNELCFPQQQAFMCPCLWRGDDHYESILTECNAKGRGFLRPPCMRMRAASEVKVTPKPLNRLRCALDHVDAPNVDDQHAKLESCGLQACQGASQHKHSGRVLGGPLKETEKTRELDNSGVLQLYQQIMRVVGSGVVRSTTQDEIPRQRELGLCCCACALVTKMSVLQCKFRCLLLA